MSENTKIIRSYFARVGRAGGKVKSEAKTQACRQNARLGGRPMTSRRKALADALLQAVKDAKKPDDRAEAYAAYLAEAPKQHVRAHWTAKLGVAPSWLVTERAEDAKAAKAG